MTKMIMAIDDYDDDSDDNMFIHDEDIRMITIL